PLESRCSASSRDLGAVYSNFCAIMFVAPLQSFVCQCLVARIFHIFSGVIGMSMWRTPSGERASTTELTTAGEQPIVPASPTPFTPSGFTGDGVVVWLLSIQGSMDALGIA